MGVFEGKVALVTGSTGGIGRAAAIAFAREGARVVAMGRRKAEGEETVRLWRGRPAGRRRTSAPTSRSGRDRVPRG